MIDIKKALKDFVATSNSGIYKDEAILLSKFPELKGYDIKALKDFVATSNSGIYKNEEELFSKFPEFNQETPVKKKVLSVQKEESPKVITTASPSEDGSLGTQFTKKKKFAFDETGKPILQKDNKVIQKLGEQAKEISKYETQIEKKSSDDKIKLEKEFVQKGQPKIDKNTNKYLNDKLKNIDSKLINNSEEYVVPQLNYQFGDLGFKFEESGATGDWMIVTAPNGKKTEVSLDPFLNSKAIAESDRLKQFIKENTPDKGLYVIEKSFSEENKKFNSQKDVDLSIKKVSDEANNLNLSLQKFLTKKNEFEKNFKETPEDIEIQKQLINERNELIKQQDRLKTKEITLKKSVGKYTEAKAQQGTWLGGTLNWLLEGASGITAGMTDVGIDILAEVTPTERQMSAKDLKTNSISISKKLGIKPPAENQTFAQWKNTLTKDQLDTVEDELDDITKKSMKSQLIPGIRESNKTLWGDKQTTPEWEKLKQEDFWGGAYAGVIKSIPAMIGGTGAGGWAQRTAQFYSQISDGIRQEMSANPEFDNVSENEKLAVILPIGITGAVLEEFGLKNIKGSTGLINNITMRVLGKVGTKATAKTFRELVENEVESRLAKGLLTITAAGLAESETGAGQQAAEYVIKDIYNSVKGKEMFDTPDTTEEWIKDVVVAGAQEAVGGFMLGVPTAVSAAYSKKGFLNMDDNTFKVFEAAANDENIQKAFITSLKTKITQGTITTAEAKEQLNNYRNSIGLFKSLPEGLDTNQKKEAMNLLKEKRDLQNQVDGKDASLVKPQKERIASIDEELTKISEKSASDKKVVDDIVKEFNELPEEKKVELKNNALEKLSKITSEDDLSDITEQEITELALKDYINSKQNSNQEQVIKQEIPSEISSLKDDEVVTLNVKTLDEVPEQFRERAILSPLAEIETRKKILGLPIGKKENKLIGGGYTYTLTGKEAKNYAIQEQTAGQVPVQSETGISGEVAQGAPETENKTTTQESQQVEALRDVESTKTALGNLDIPWFDDFQNNFGKDKYKTAIDVSEAYHKAKADGSNPELVQAVEELLAPQTIINEQVSSKTQENKTETPTVSEATQGLSEAELPGYNRMINEVEGIVSKSKNRGVSEPKIAENVMNYVMGSKVYETATDVQREALVREVNKRFGIKEKAAPSANRILGKLKDITKITMSEKVALVKQIKDTARGAKQAVKSAKILYEQLSNEIKELSSNGKITDNQAKNAIRAFSKVNVFSEKSVGRFGTYMMKLFANAEYANDLKNAKSLRSEIKKLSKNKDKNANLRDLATKFSEIEPSLIDDIVAYNEMATKIKEAIKGSSIRGQKVNFAQTTNIQDANNYINEILKEQKQKIREEMIAELQDLMGVDASEFSAEQMLALLEPEAKTNKYNEGIVRATVKKAFNIYSSMINESVKTGKDLFTDEDVNFSKSQKDIIKRFMDMDTDKMDVKDSLAAVDSLINFLENQSTAKMESVIAKYKGQQNADELNKEGIRAIKLKKAFSESFGRFLGEQITTLPILFEKMFKGFNAAGYVMDKMGLTNLVNKKAYAQNQSNSIVNDYVKQFFKKKANNQKFNTAFNNVERGMAAFMMRNIIGNEAEMKAEFDRRKNLVKESIEVLSGGNKEEVKKSLVYQEVYDKVLDGSNTIEDVQSKTDETNLDAINFWTEQWSNQYDKLLDVSLNIYNKVLDKDLNYTPDRFTKISYDGGTIELANDESAFHNNNGTLYKKETGVLMSAVRPEKLPVNEDTKEVSSYIDLSFDKNNSNSMYDALVDIETAAPIREIEAFMKSPDFRRIFGQDSDIIKGTKTKPGRIQLYIQNIRNKNPYSNDELSKTLRKLNKISSFGASLALAGPTQPIKQVIPVAINTLINSKGNFNIISSFNPDFNSWLNDLGYGISNRGIESQAQIDTVNKLIDEASNSNIEKAGKIIEKINDVYLKIFLAKPDIFIARASWKTYYEQSLKKQGVDIKKLDYSNHEVNETAANYAQRMVDRQQNISDIDLSGKLFSNKETGIQILKQIFMPFASFRMNQSSRLGADLSTIGYWNVSSKEDKEIAVRSLSGFAAEMATFKILSVGISLITSKIANAVMGKDDNDDEKEKEKIIKGQATGLVSDIVSPLPIFDKLVQYGAAKTLDLTQDLLNISNEDKVSLYSPITQDQIEQLGMFGIAAQRASQTIELINLYVIGNYKDNYGKIKEISEDDKDNLGKLIGPSILSSIGIFPPEVSSVIRKAIRLAKKKQSKPKKQANQLLIDLETGVEYDNKTDLERYNPELYEKNFGEGSEWYESTKEEREAKKKEEKEKQEIKDKTFNYTPKSKDEFGSKKFGGTKNKSKKSSGGFGSSKFGN